MGELRDDGEGEDCTSGSASGEVVVVERRFCVRKMEPRDFLAWVERRDLRAEKNFGGAVSENISFSSFSFSCSLSFQILGGDTSSCVKCWCDIIPLVLTNRGSF